MHSINKLVDKAALLTGASRSIGQAISERLRRDKASVISNYASNIEKKQGFMQVIPATKYKTNFLRLVAGCDMEVFGRENIYQLVKKH